MHCWLPSWVFERWSVIFTGATLRPTFDDYKQPQNDTQEKVELKEESAEKKAILIRFNIADFGNSS